MNMSLKKLFSISLKQEKERSIKSVTQIGMTSLDTTITFMERRTLSMQINYLRGELIVKVPHQVSQEQALKFIREKESWLIRKIAQGNVRKANHNQREYTHESKHLLLGKTFTLNIVETNKRTEPLFADTSLTIYVRGEDQAKIALRKWYTKIAPSLFSSIIAPIITDFSVRYSKSPSTMEYKYVTSYWGQCSSRGCIKLNIELLRAPRECIEYIIAHELCHLIHQNHSKRFYDLLTEFMPDWKERKSLLDKTITCKY